MPKSKNPSGLALRHTLDQNHCNIHILSEIEFKAVFSGGPYPSFEYLQSINVTADACPESGV